MKNHQIYFVFLIAIFFYLFLFYSSFYYEGIFDFYNYHNPPYFNKILNTLCFFPKLVDSFVFWYFSFFPILFILTLLLSFDTYYVEQKKYVFIAFFGFFGIGFFSIFIHKLYLSSFVFIIGLVGGIVSLYLIRRMYNDLKFFGFLSETNNSDKYTNKYSKTPSIYNRFPNQWKNNANKIVFPLYDAHKKDRFINFKEIYRHFLCVAGPGGGKSASVLKPYIYNTIVERQATAIIYDFKSPELTRLSYKFYLESKKKFGVNYKTNFYNLNFDNPFNSHQLNPLSPVYLTDYGFATELVATLYKNLKGGGNQKDDPFWDGGARSIILVIIWYLVKKSKDKNINVSNFLHLLSAISSPYSNKLLHVCYQDIDMRQTISSIYKSIKSENTFAGLIASANNAIAKLNDPNILWVTLNDNIKLNVNNAENPAILCISNNPEKQEAYSPIISVIFVLAFSKINIKVNGFDDKQNVSCSVIIDELPTIYLPKLDQLMNTGRSNKLSVMLAMQGLSQLDKTYGKEEAKNVIAGALNVLYGSSNELENNKQISELIGKGEDKKQSKSLGKETSRTINNEFFDILSPAEVTEFSQGTFAGICAGGASDNIKNPSNKKFIAPFRYNDYGEYDLPQLPKTLEFKQNNLTEKELFDRHINKLRVGASVLMDKMILIDFWTVIFNEYFDRKPKERQVYGYKVTHEFIEQNYLEFEEFANANGPKSDEFEAARRTVQPMLEKFFEESLLEAATIENDNPY